MESVACLADMYVFRRVGNNDPAARDAFCLIKRLVLTFHTHQNVSTFGIFDNLHGYCNLELNFI